LEHPRRSAINKGLRGERKRVRDGILSGHRLLVGHNGGILAREPGDKAVVQIERPAGFLTKLNRDPARAIDQVHRFRGQNEIIDRAMRRERCGKRSRRQKSGRDHH
jgi:hypothetical protein